MSPKVPERIAWAVELLRVQPDDQILELGCGPGVAAALVAEQLAAGDGRLVAIDRSATAVERARARTAPHVAAGRVELRQVDVADFRSEPRQFDTAFAVNLNVFWTSPADAELRVLAAVLRPGGNLHLVYEGPPGSGAPEVGPAIATRLEHHGFATEITDHGGPSGRLVCVTGRARLTA
jgi:cyclopropane fatty-acyl-phospholipid synthase-like methyltransferase